MFPGWTAKELFGPTEHQHTTATDDGLLSSIA
jgi:hypothetical protein